MLPNSNLMISNEGITFSSVDGSFYYNINTTYNPASKEERIPLITKPNLKPKSKEGALKYGFYLIHNEWYSKAISTNVRHFEMFGKTWFHYFPHLKFANSSLLHKLGIWALRINITIQR